MTDTDIFSLSKHKLLRLHAAPCELCVSAAQTTLHCFATTGRHVPWLGGLTLHFCTAAKLSPPGRLEFQPSYGRAIEALRVSWFTLARGI